MPTFAPGTRLRVREEEWLVQNVDRASDGTQVLNCVGLSELVRDLEFRFIAELEGDLEVVDPAKTKLVADTSPRFRQSRLYIESLLRKRAPTEDLVKTPNLHVGHRAAMDAVPYQWEPALQALEQPRQRILIADSTGLGKTLEAGILMSELIERGRGKRILVVALKSMMTQLQKEWWTRFTIPLVRLDSRGIQRIRQEIPTNHNPFLYLDKTIISIDTLKRGAEYRTYIENAHWDIVVIDEAQNVAERGSASQRNRLARLLARRCDTMIMLSATPHDGRPESFASLMNMLDPTAIANPSDYTRDDIEGLFIRRFKGDIQDQVDSAFPERDIGIGAADASAYEESAYDVLADLDLVAIDEKGSGDVLFKTTLEKALFSSPAACRETLQGRIDRLAEEGDPAYDADRQQLQTLLDVLQPVGAGQFSKYQRLLQLLRGATERDFEWDGSDPEDRLVIFSERLETLRFLHEHLQEDLDLPEGAIQMLHGGLSDVEQQDIVDAFGNDDADVRLLLASDIASEGINLHYLCHRLIHFDIPWSLMIFQQRNGRIDRYGQERRPQIRYLVTNTGNARIHGDLRILELLIRKEEQAVSNIEDPASLMGVYDVDREEAITARAIEEGQSAEEFDAGLAGGEEDFMEFLLGGGAQDTEDLRERLADPLSLFRDDYTYLQTALAHLDDSDTEELHYELDDDRRVAYVTANDDLLNRFDRLPDEIVPENRTFGLTADADAMQKNIRAARRKQEAWPSLQYLWKLHPVMRWVDDKVVSSFRRHEAPVLFLPTLEADERIVLCSALIPNQKGQPLLNPWVGMRFNGHDEPQRLELHDVVEKAGLTRSDLANARREETVPSELQDLVPDAVDHVREWMTEERDRFEKRINEPLQHHLDRLEQLKARKVRQLDFAYASKDWHPGKIEKEKGQDLRRIDRLFDEYIDWIEKTMTTDPQAHIQVIGVLAGASRDDRR